MLSIIPYGKRMFRLPNTSKASLGVEKQQYFQCLNIVLTINIHKKTYQVYIMLITQVICTSKMRIIHKDRQCFKSCFVIWYKIHGVKKKNVLIGQPLFLASLKVSIRVHLYKYFTMHSKIIHREIIIHVVNVIA